MATTPSHLDLTDATTNASAYSVNTTVVYQLNIKIRPLDWVDYAEIIGLSLVAFFGIPGNVLITLVQLKLPDITSTDYLIANLASFDFFDSAVNVPVNIVFVALGRSYLNNIACKFIGLFAFWASTSSAAFIGVLAIDRYILTCKPLQTRYNKLMAKRICITLSIATFIFSCPTFVYVEHDDGLYTCTYDSQIMNVYFLVLAVLTLVDFVTIAVLYGKIAFMLRKRELKQKPSFATLNSDTCTNASKEMVVTSRGPSSINNEDTNSSEFIPFTVDRMSHQTDRSDQSVCVNKTCMETLNRDKPRFTQNERFVPEKALRNTSTSFSKNTKQEALNRATRILLAITVIYIISWMIGSVVIGTQNRLPRVLHQLLYVLRRSNNVSNPILFITMSTKFRQNARRILCGQKCKSDNLKRNC